VGVITDDGNGNGMAGDGRTADRSIIAGGCNDNHATLRCVIQRFFHLPFPLRGRSTEGDAQVQNARTCLHAFAYRARQGAGVGRGQLSFLLRRFLKNCPHEERASWADCGRRRAPPGGEDSCHEGAVPPCRTGRGRGRGARAAQNGRNRLNAGAFQVRMIKFDGTIHQSDSNSGPAAG
jgi:hypothetical protein